MPYWRLFYHVTWATKDRQPLIQREFEVVIRGHLLERAKAMNCLAHGAAVLADHVHLVTSVPPSLALSDVIGKLKGGTAHFVNHLSVRMELPLVWQDGYGVASFGEKQLPWVLEYLSKQREHHDHGAVHAALEDCRDL